MPINLDDPVELLFATVDALTSIGLEHAVCGGLALAAYGEPRETKDADLAVANLSVAAAQTSLARTGFTVVNAFSDVTFGGLLISRLTLLGGGKLNMVDFVKPASARYARGVLERTILAPLRGREMRIVSPEDFVLLKVLSTREKDVEDAGSVLRALGSRLELDLIDTEIALLATENPSHGVVDRWRRIRSET